jgi:hypothetical protein
MAREIKNGLDYLVAQAQNDTDVAKMVLEEIRKGVGDSKDRYYDEKIALKMLEFFTHEEKFITLYAEAKTEYPILAELMENKKPYLRDLLAEADKLYKKASLLRINTSK